jgi:hypothetical protein
MTFYLIADDERPVSRHNHHVWGQRPALILVYRRTRTQLQDAVSQDHLGGELHGSSIAVDGRVAQRLIGEIYLYVVVDAETGEDYAGPATVLDSDAAYGWIVARSENTTFPHDGTHFQYGSCMPASLAALVARDFFGMTP